MMSFLNQLKSQASALRSEQEVGQRNLSERIDRTEAACATVAAYLRDLAAQLNVIEPPGARFSLDGKTPWPAMKLHSFNTDMRKKMLREKEVYDYAAMGWTISAKMGVGVGGSVSSSFVPEIEKIQQALNFAHIEHVRKDIRHPERKSLQSVRFDYTTQARGNVTVKADHEAGQLVFRLANANGFGITNTTIASERVDSNLMDELAKLILNQPSNFA
jgi:hypothetical protein